MILELENSITRKMGESKKESSKEHEKLMNIMTIISTDIVKLTALLVTAGSLKRKGVTSRVKTWTNNRNY